VPFVFRTGCEILVTWFTYGVSHSFYFRFGTFSKVCLHYFKGIFR